MSAERLGLDDVARGPFVRDIQAEGRVVAAFSPTLFAPQAGAVTLQVHAGDTVKKGQVLATIASPDLAAKLAQELATADTLQTDTLRAQVEAGEQHAALQGARENAAIDVKAAETDLARQQKAFDAGAAAGMQVDHARDALEKARIALSARRGRPAFEGRQPQVRRAVARSRRTRARCCWWTTSSARSASWRCARRSTARSASCSSPSAPASPRTRSCSR